MGRFFRRGTPEVHSGIPVEGIPAQRPLTIQEMVQKYIREEMSAQARAEGAGTFDDEDDFTVDDDDDDLPLTHHQVMAMTDSELAEEASNYGIELTNDSHAGSPGATEAPAVGSGGTPPTVAPATKTVPPSPAPQ